MTALRYQILCLRLFSVRLGAWKAKYCYGWAAYVPICGPKTPRSG